MHPNGGISMHSRNAPKTSRMGVAESGMGQAMRRSSVSMRASPSTTSQRIPFGAALQVNRSPRVEQSLRAMRGSLASPRTTQNSAPPGFVAGSRIARTAVGARTPTACNSASRDRRTWARESSTGFGSSGFATTGASGNSTQASPETSTRNPPSASDKPTGWSPTMSSQCSSPT